MLARFGYVRGRFGHGCADPPPCPAPAGAVAAQAVYLVNRGWHVDIGLPAESLMGRLAVFRDTFPGARTIMFGYGKRTFLTAPPDSISEYLRGLIPGPSAIEVTALTVLPPDAYPSGQVARLALADRAARGLSAFIWTDFQQDGTGEPRRIGPGPFTGSEFYAARSGYSLAHTCNTWAAEALAAGGPGMSGFGVVLSGQVVSRATEGGACLAAPRR